MDKETLLTCRKNFFERIVSFLLLPPSKIDELLGQSQYYVLPNEKEILINPEFGDMVIPVNGEFYGKSFHIFYSFWQVSDILKIGIALNDPDLQGAFVSDTHNEVQGLWNKTDPIIDVSHGCVFYDWEFEMPDLYDNYKKQEKYILGVRHMHFRTMKVIHNECFKLSNLK